MNNSSNSLGTLRFEKHQVRAIYDERDSVVWLCLYDVLKVLGRIELIENGQAMRICRTAFRIPFKTGGRNRWGVKPFDLHPLLRTISSENGMIAKVCRKMEKWVNSLPMHMEPTITITTQPTSTGEPIIFNYQDKFPITFKASNGRTYVNATQMSRSFDKYPYVWLGLAHVKEFRQMLVDTGKSGSLDSQVFTTRGANGATWIEDSLAMEFARWLSPEFSDWCNSRINELVSTGYVSMQHAEQPTPIRTEYRKTLEEAVGNFPVPKNFEEALLLAAEHERKLRENEHKVAFYDEFVENRDYYRSIRIADELEISIVALNRFLAEEGIIYFENKQWIVHAPYRPLQCDVPYMWQKSPGKVYPTGSVKRWTKTGREYIIELWYTRHPELMLKPKRL